MPSCFCAAFAISDRFLVYGLSEFYRFEGSFYANFVQMNDIKRVSYRETLSGGVTPSGFKPETF